MTPKKLFLFCLSCLVVLLASTSCLPVVSETNETKSDPRAESAQARGDVSTKPILRIETGMHTAMIRRIATDAKRKILATASDDKTVRIWAHSASLSDRTLYSSFTSSTLHSKDRSLSGVEGNASPTLLRVIRPPIGDGDEGKLYAVALEPEGKILASGGWTSKDGLSNSIYFFDVATGSLLYSIAGLENRILHLSFSDEGNFLAVILKAGKGIRVYQKKKGKYELFAEDREYGADSYGAEFYSDDAVRLATTCLDGFIRLYTIEEKGDKNKKDSLRLDAKIQTKSSKQPYGLAFSPDGKNLAVGYDDSTGLDVYTIGKSKLEYSFSPDTSTVTYGNLIAVTYSGDALYAGGMYGKAPFDSVQGTVVFSILKFPQAGKGKPIEISVSKDTIMSILPDGKGGVFFGAQDPLFGQLDSKGKLLFTKVSEIADYRAMGEIFSVSEINSSFQFAFEYGGKNKALFSLANRMIVSDVKTLHATSLRPPIVTHDKIKIENWYNKFNPTCDGNPISLQQYETSRSLAIQKDGTAFVLGTEWLLRYFDSTCKELWNIPIPSIAWAVNLSPDGRYALAAFGDGTIRWYSTKDGKELLTFFPHADKKRWVLWTPEGYYDASVGGEDLIGWHINRGKDKESDFFSVGKFRDAYYRPDIITKVLEVGDTEKAILAANADRQKNTDVLPISKSLPSVVRIRSPESGKPITNELVDFRTTIRSPSGLLVKELKVFIDDSLAQTFPVDFSPSDPEDVMDFKFQLKVPQKKTMEISIVTVTEKGVSDPQRIQLLGKQGEDKKPNLHLLAVGVGDYKDKKNIRALNFSVADAKDFFTVMKKQEGKVYTQVNAEEKYLLTDQSATRDNIVNSIIEIQNRSLPEDFTMIFLSGHGTSDVENRFYFLPHEYDTQRKHTTGVSGSELMTHLSKIKGKVILFVDACYSGGLSANGLNVVRLFNEASDPDKRFVVFSSSSKFEESLEHKDWQNGAFTKAFKEALEGKLNKKKITIKNLDSYISERVPELTKNKQTPESQGTGKDFTIAEAVK